VSGHVESSSILQEASDILSSLGRVSFLAIVNEVAVGHATILEGRHEITDQAYADLFDILVEPGDHQRLVRRELVKASAKYANTLGVPLIGNVTHDLADPADIQGRNILDGLTASGWTPDHVDWWVIAR
jgi:hypothetical protein